MASESLADMSLGISSLRSAVKRKFATAQQSKDLIFSDTNVTILRTRHGSPFQLRFCPALSNKPTDNKPKEDKSTPKPKFDPFADPSPELLVARIPATEHTHNIVLNKYPVIPNHFILATKENLPQTDLLDPTDLATTYAILHAWDHDNSEDTVPSDAPSNNSLRSLFAFFNSGPHSGASQPHRHIQFLPTPDMQIGLLPSSPLSTSPTWRPLIEDITTHTLISSPIQIDTNPTLPFLALSTPLNPSLTPSELHTRYLTLLRAATTLSQSQSQSQSQHPTLTPTLLSTTPITTPTPSRHVTISYNLALTTTRIAILPRRAESATIPNLPDSAVALNGTVLGGTMMVKESREWERLCAAELAGEGMVDGVLAQIGFGAVGGDGGLGEGQRKGNGDGGWGWGWGKAVILWCGWGEREG